MEDLNNLNNLDNSINIENIETKNNFKQDFNSNNIKLATEDILENKKEKHIKSIDDLEFEMAAKKYFKSRIYSAENMSSLIENFNDDISILLSYGVEDEIVSVGTFKLDSIEMNPDDHSKDSWTFVKNDDKNSKLIVPMSQIKQLVELGIINASNSLKDAEEMNKASLNEVLAHDIIEANLPKAKTLPLEDSDIEYLIDGVPQNSNYAIYSHLGPLSLRKVRERVFPNHKGQLPPSDSLENYNVIVEPNDFKKTEEKTMDFPTI